MSETQNVSSSRRIPTENQYRMLRGLHASSAGLSWGKRATEQLLRRGWVTAEWHEPYYQWVRITPAGLHALAQAVEKYGLPDLGPHPKRHQHYCSKCGSTRIYSRIVDVDIPQPVAA